jgi:adenylate cyclase class IV
MGYRNREIEKKFEVLKEPGFHYKLENVAQKLRRICSYSISDTVIGTSSDEYWKPKRGMKIDFARLRSFEDGTCQVTVKFADRGSNTNRVEIDMHVKDPKSGRAFLNQILGPSVRKITKTYFVYFMGNEDTTISVYKVPGFKEIYVETEARTVSKMRKMISMLDDLPWKLRWEKRNLFQIVTCAQGKSRRSSRTRARRASR